MFVHQYKKHYHVMNYGLLYYGITSDDLEMFMFMFMTNRTSELQLGNDFGKTKIKVFTCSFVIRL